jgi:protein-tyrosine phosphatase
MKNKVKVLMVCMGNICRSPTADGVMTALVKQKGLEGRIEVDSAGTHAYHVGEMSDSRSRAKAKERGVDLDYIRARKVTQSDFENFDYVLAMDEDNYQILLDACPEKYKSRVNKFLSYAKNLQNNVPDPYYGGANGFDNVFDLVKEGCDYLFRDIEKHHL